MSRAVPNELQLASVPPFPVARVPAYTLGTILVLFLAWMIPGLAGHDPWKIDEATNFGVIYAILKYGYWAVPTLAGEPYVENPPLYYWITAVIARLLAFLLPMHDAARFSSAFFMSLTIGFTALTARKLYGPGHGRVAALVLIGSVGLILHAHEMIGEIALMAALSAVFYGLAFAAQRPLRAGLFLGLGLGSSFLTAGFPQASMIIIVLLALPAFVPDWRNAKYLQVIGIGLVISLPFFLVWPWLLYQHDAALFRVWFWQNNIAVLSRAANKEVYPQVYYFIKTLPWFAWPAWPLALWTLWCARGSWRQPAIALPLIAFWVIFFISSLLASASDVYVLPMLIPLALLAAGAAETLRKGAISALEWFGLMTFGLLAGILWTGWFALQTGAPERLAAKLARMQPGFIATIDVLPLLIGIAFTAAWLLMVFKRRRSAELALGRWAMGLILMWGILVTLWMPWIDRSKSYRATFYSLRAALPANYDCIASQSLGEPQRALLEYFSGIVTKRVEITGRIECSLILMQGNSRQRDVTPGPMWRLIWEGHRPGDKVERLKLFQK